MNEERSNPCVSMVPVPSPYALCKGPCGLTIATAYVCNEHGLCGPCHDVNQEVGGEG
jgi:hypothetical protein